MPIPATLDVEYQDEIVYILTELALAGYIRLVIDYPGPLDENRLRIAIRRLIDAEPVLGCRFLIEEGERPLWRRRDDLDRLADCPVTNSDDLDAATQVWLAERFNPQTSPNLSVALIRSPTQQGDRLLLRVSHVAADGVGVLTVAANLFDLYSRLRDDPEWRPTPNPASRASFLWLRNSKRRNRLQLLLQDLGGLPAALEKKRGLIAHDKESFLNDVATVQPLYGLLRLGEQRVVALERYSKQQGVTLHDVCLTAFLRAFDEFCPSPSNAGLAVAVPTNLRRYAPLQRRPAICNLTGGGIFRIGANVGKTFEDSLAKVRQEALRHNRLLVGTEGQIFSLWLAGMSFTRKRALIRRQYLSSLKSPVPPAFTNLGHVSSRRFACDSQVPTALAFFGEAAPAPIFFTSVIRMDNQLSFGFAYDRRFGAKRMEAFMERLEQHLPVCGA